MHKTKGNSACKLKLAAVVLCFKEKQKHKSPNSFPSLLCVCSTYGYLARSLGKLPPDGPVDNRMVPNERVPFKNGGGCSLYYSHPGSMEANLEGRDPGELFREIYHRSQKLGISRKELSKLPYVRKLRSGCGDGQNFSRNLSFAFLGVVVLFCAVVFAGGLRPVLLMVSRGCFHVLGLDMKSEMCILYMPSEVQNIFMPPVDCSMCRNLTGIERVRNISPVEFENRFAYSMVPVVVADGAMNWTALDVFSLDFFRALYLAGLEDPYSEVERECQFFPYKTEFVNLADALSMSPEREKKPWYIGWSNCDSEIGNILRTHYSRPYFLPPLSESANIDWIFMGKPGHGAHLHIDHVNNPSWQAQIRGSKLWTLEPVPECYHECKTIEVLVQPGEVIVLDTNRWYHKTLITGDELSITIGSEYD